MNFVILSTDLRTEIEKLKCQTGLINDDGFKTSLDEVRRLREQLLKKEKEMAELTRLVPFFHLHQNIFAKCLYLVIDFWFLDILCVRKNFFRNVLRDFIFEYY